MEMRRRKIWGSEIGGVGVEGERNCERVGGVRKNRKMNVFTL